MARGCREARNACHTRAVAPWSRLAPPRPRAGQPTVCVCVPHSPAHFAGRAAREAGAGCGACGERREPARDATRAAVGHRMCSAVCVRPPGWRRARLGAKEMRVAQVCGRGGALPADEKSSNKVFQSREAGRGAGGVRLDRGPSPSRSASAARRARARSKKRRRKAAARRAPTAEEAHRMHAGNPRSSKRHAAPRARAGGHAARSSDCGGEAGGGLGGNGERRWRGRCDVDHWLPAASGARERRGAACADLLPDTFPPLPVNGCRFGRESGPLRLPGWAAASGG